MRYRRISKKKQEESKAVVVFGGGQDDEINYPNLFFPLAPFPRKIFFFVINRRARWLFCINRNPGY